MRVYLAGPITGIKDFNRPAFNAAADRLRRQGHEVFNPTTLNMGSIGETLSYELDYICTQAEAVAFLPGWERSGGAKIEHSLAVYLERKLIYLEDVSADEKASSCGSDWDIFVYPGS